MSIAMRWLMVGLIALCALQSVYIYRLSHLTDEPVSEAVDVARSPVPPVVRPPMAEPLCGVELRGVSIIDGEYYASLGRGGAVLQFHNGQYITPQSYIESIGPDSITIHHDAIRQRLPLTVTHASAGSEQHGTSATASEGFPDSSVPPGGMLGRGIPNRYKDSIQVLADNVLSIRRDLIKQALESPDALAKTRFAFSSKGGFQATQVEGDSLFAGLGLETGDIIKSINSNELMSVSDVMTAYQQMQNSQMVEVRLQRQGQDLFYFYHLTDH